MARHFRNSILIGIFLFVLSFDSASLASRNQNAQTYNFLPLTSRPFLATVSSAYTYGTSQYSFQILAEVTNISPTESVSVTLQTASRIFHTTPVVTSTTLLRPAVVIIPPGHTVPAIANGINPGIEILRVNVLQSVIISDVNVVSLSVVLEKIEPVFDRRCAVYGKVYNTNTFPVKDIRLSPTIRFRLWYTGSSYHNQEARWDGTN
jgi:hypothetical protein